MLRPAYGEAGVRGVSTIQGFLMYTSNGNSVGTLVNVHYKCPLYRGCLPFSGVRLEGFHYITS